MTRISRITTEASDGDEPPGTLPLTLARTAHPRSLHRLAVHGSSVNNLALRFSGIARGRPIQSTASWPSPLCVFAPRRLCVGTEAVKTQRRKDARHQTDSRWPPNKMLSELSDCGYGSAKERKLIRCHRFSQTLFRNVTR